MDMAETAMSELVIRSAGQQSDARAVRVAAETTQLWADERSIRRTRSLARPLERGSWVSRSTRSDMRRRGPIRLVPRVRGRPRGREAPAQSGSADGNGNPTGGRPGSVGLRPRQPDAAGPARAEARL